MEYTKDIILEIQYEDKPERKSLGIEKHTWISFMVTLLVFLTLVDAILMVQFFEVLKEL